MARVLSLAIRGIAAFSASVMMLAGLTFATGGIDDPTGMPSAGLRVIDFNATAQPAAPKAQATPNAEPAAAIGSQSSGPTVVPAPSAAVPAALPVAAPNRPPPATSTYSAPPVTDLPKYTDVAVLALAASAVLPSGLTFRECVELPPSHEKWPSPVHLYYMGNGRWLVETHVSEVQVVFEESTATFKAGNFAPTSPGCR